MVTLIKLYQNILIMRALLNVLIISCFLVVASTGCKKTQGPLPFPKNYIAKMGNVRQWHGTKSGSTGTGYNNSIVSVPYSYILTDAFALQINTGASIVSCNYFGSYEEAGGSFTYYTADTTANYYIIFYSNNGSALAYYYQADSMVIVGNYLGTGGTEYVFLTTP